MFHCPGKEVSPNIETLELIFSTGLVLISLEKEVQGLTGRKAEMMFQVFCDLQYEDYY